jgi:hypothetical protein
MRLATATKSYARRRNRQLNTAIHRIAVMQIRMDSAGRRDFQRRLAEGDTRRRGLGALKCRLSRVVLQSLRADREAARTSMADRRQRPDRSTAAHGAPSHLISGDRADLVPEIVHEACCERP